MGTVAPTGRNKRGLLMGIGGRGVGNRQCEAYSQQAYS